MTQCSALLYNNEQAPVDIGTCFNYTDVTHYNDSNRAQSMRPLAIYDYSISNVAKFTAVLAKVGDTLYTVY